ncbi:hypothetical protein [Paenibacillus sp. BC26]|uniref:hypothetical protein n=1 Tax=Paenibacillus sp. BC26 TaxID=1881032 RepID=UPI0011604E06|nr:hypothetical protein [Paenibacillus sp. BC26]
MAPSTNNRPLFMGSVIAEEKVMAIGSLGGRSIHVIAGAATSRAPGKLAIAADTTDKLLSRQACLQMRQCQPQAAERSQRKQRTFNITPIYKSGGILMQLLEPHVVDKQVHLCYNPHFILTLCRSYV